jgi:hypothetical protein
VLAENKCSEGYPEAQQAADQGAVMVPVVTGFIAHDASGRVTTLGRGGSDLTAAVIGAAAGFSEIQVLDVCHFKLSPFRGDLWDSSVLITFKRFQNYHISVS